MDIKKVLEGTDYDFIRKEERLGKQIDFLCFGGSISYGLNGPTSDIDIRGVCSPLKRDILGSPYLPNPLDLGNKQINMQQSIFEQYLDANTDTCIYNVNKYINLIYNANPNTLEMLGCLPEHYAYVSDVGKLLLDNKDIFLSKRAYYTFIAYARQQFIRLQNSLCRKATRLDQLLQTMSVIERTYAHLEESFPSFKRDMIEFYIVDGCNGKIDTVATDAFFSNIILDNAVRKMDSSEKEEVKEKLGALKLDNCELKMNLNMNDITPNDFKGVMGELNNIIQNFSQYTGHRNHKKDSFHEDKHASHLRRLQITARKILVDHKIETHLDGDDLQECLDIKHGAWRRSDGMYKPEFFDYINREMAKLEEIYEHCTLPEGPDILKVLALVYQINEAALNR